MPPGPGGLGGPGGPLGQPMYGAPRGPYPPMQNMPPGQMPPGYMPQHDPMLAGQQNYP